MIILDSFPLYTLAFRTNAFANGGSEELNVFYSEVTCLHKQFQQLLGPVSLILTYLLSLIHQHVSVPGHRSMLLLQEGGPLTLLLSTWVRFPNKISCSVITSPRTVHFRVLDESPVSGPGGGPPSCNTMSTLHMCQVT